MIKETEGGFTGTYFGLEFAGEHGRFYYVTRVENLEEDREGYISFEIPKRDFLTEPVWTLEEAREKAARRATWGGGTRESLHMKGSIRGGYLVLECESEYDGCYERTKRFKREAR